MTFTIEQASAQLALLIEKAASGEEVYISRDNASAIRLTPVVIPEGEPMELPLLPRVPGLGKGQVWIAPDFDAPMPDDWLDEFYKGDIFPCEG
jgi:antitoxin (DNA-binding transcriptional repressor) of toxin-antitoxin stability system